MRADQDRRFQFLKFVVVGVLNTAVGLGVIFAAKALLGWGDLAANAFGYGVGLLSSFVLNRNWTFRDRGRISTAAVRFFAAFALGYSANLATVFALRDLAALDSYLAQAAGAVPYTLLFFFASRAFVFLDANRISPAAPVAAAADAKHAGDGRLRTMLLVLTLAMLAIAAYRGGAILLSKPMLALANNYDMIRVQACIKAYPVRPQEVPPWAGNADAPLERYRFRYDIAAPCYFSTEVLFARLARPLFKAESKQSEDGAFSIRWLGAVKLIALLSIVIAFTLAWWRRGQPGSAAANAAVAAVVLTDPAITIYMNGFYAEFSTVLFAYASIGGAALLIGRARPPRLWSLALLSVAVGAFVCTKVQHIGMGLMLALALAAPALAGSRTSWRTIAAVAVGGAAGLALQAANLAKSDNEVMRLANLTSTVLTTILPLSEDPYRTAERIGIPRRCGAYAGLNWYLPPVREDPANHPCREVVEASYPRLLGLAVTEPGLFARFVGGSLNYVRPWIPSTYRGVPHLGVVEGQKRAPLPSSWFTWSRILDRLPLWLVQALVVAPGFLVGALVFSRRLRDPATAAVLSALAFLPYPTAVAVIFGNGYEDAAKQMHLIFVLVICFWLLLALRSAGRFGTRIADE